MTYYMPQDLFNSAVLVLALGEYVAATSPNPENVYAQTAKAMHAYTSFFTEDDFLPEAEDCATRALEWVKGLDPDDPTQTMAWLAALSDAMMKYEPSGKRKPWRLFNGLKFTSSREPVPDRPVQFFKDLVMYYLHIQTGKIGG